MASSKDYLAFVLEQLSDLRGISYREMMGEFIIYYNGRIVGGIYDNRFLVKPVKSALELIENPRMEIPYPGAKEMVLVEDIDNREFLVELFKSMYSELPVPKNR